MAGRTAVVNPYLDLKSQQLDWMGKDCLSSQQHPFGCYDLSQKVDQALEVTTRKLYCHSFASFAVRA